MGSVKKQIKVVLQERVDPVMLYGDQDRYLRMLERAFRVQIGGRGDVLTIDGNDENMQLAEKALRDLAALSLAGFRLSEEDVLHAIRGNQQEAFPSFEQEAHDPHLIPIYGKKKFIAPKSLMQQSYVHAMQNTDIVVGIGPAGTGKTYLAMAMAVSALIHKEVQRIILARPAVEAGEKLGFLPGDMIEKVNPYLRPLYDALYGMMDTSRVNQLIERGDIEIAPLAFMRGRTLHNAFIILDEAQNTTPEQMKMFLTRMGFHSKVVITGDVTQTDLPSGRPSGLVEIQEILKGIAGIQFIYFSETDVVRHTLVQEIIKAYDRQKNGLGNNQQPEKISP